MSFKVGQTVTLTTTVKKAGVLVDPTTVTHVLYKPDGSTSSPTVTPISTGVYASTFVVDQPGRWLFHHTSTGGGADGFDESWFVVDATEKP